MVWGAADLKHFIRDLAPSPLWKCCTKSLEDLLLHSLHLNTLTLMPGLLLHSLTVWPMANMFSRVKGLRFRVEGLASSLGRHVRVPAWTRTTL